MRSHVWCWCRAIHVVILALRTQNIELCVTACARAARVLASRLQWPFVAGGVLAENVGVCGRIILWADYVGWLMCARCCQPKMEYEALSLAGRGD